MKFIEPLDEEKNHEIKAWLMSILRPLIAHVLFPNIDMEILAIAS